VISLEWYRKFLVVFSVAVFFTALSDYTEQFGFSPLKWIMAMGALTAPLLVMVGFEARFRWQPLFIWGLGYLLITVIWYYPGPQDATDFRLVRLRFLSVIFLCLMLFIFSRPGDVLLARQTVAAGVLLGVGLNIYEQFHPMTFSDVPGRSSGLYANINQSGCALMLGMILSKDIVPKRFRFLFCVLAGIGIVTTFSRAAMLGWILVMGFSVVRSGVDIRKISQALVALGLVFAFFSSAYWQHVSMGLEQRGALNASVVQRLQFFSQGDTQDASATERQAVAAYALHLFEQKPIFGWGTGAGRNLEAFSVGTHNIYLNLMIDHGLVGVFIMPWLLLAIIWGCRRNVLDVAVPYVMFVILWGFFSHNVLEERYLLLTVALAGSMVFQERFAAKQTPAAVEAAQDTARAYGAFA